MRRSAVVGSVGRGAQRVDSSRESRVLRARVHPGAEAQAAGRRPADNREPPAAGDVHLLPGRRPRDEHHDRDRRRAVRAGRRGQDPGVGQRVGVSRGGIAARRGCRVSPPASPAAARERKLLWETAMYAALPSWKAGTVLAGSALGARSRSEPAAANCSNKRATWRFRRLFAAGQARTTLNAARSATLQAGGLIRSRANSNNDVPRAQFVPNMARNCGHSLLFRFSVFLCI
jgi:hypothetical protein